MAIEPYRLEVTVMKSITRFISDDQGADLIEYALLTGLIALAAVVTLGNVSTSLNLLYGKIKTKLDAVP
jgi:Flp pilus assembly pilin Flp